MGRPPPPPPPDWSQMLPEILEVIIGYIAMLPDALAAAAVCRSWHTAAAAALRRAMTDSRRLLWLLMAVPRSYGDWPDVELYDIFNGVSRRGTLPGILNPIFNGDGAWIKILGSYPGWLLVVHGVDRRLSLVSPFTAAHIRLPHCPPDLERSIKAVVYAGPSSGSYRVLLLGKTEVYVTVSGDEEWRLELSIAQLLLCDCVAGSSP